MSNNDDVHTQRYAEPNWQRSGSIGHDPYENRYKHGYSGVPDHRQYRSAYKSKEYDYYETPTHNRFDALNRGGDWY